jgi:hypothetical protein
MRAHPDRVPARRTVANEVTTLASGAVCAAALGPQAHAIYPATNFGAFAASVLAAAPDSASVLAAYAMLCEEAHGVTAVELPAFGADIVYCLPQPRLRCVACSYGDGSKHSNLVMSAWPGHRRSPDHLRRMLHFMRATLLSANALRLFLAEISRLDPAHEVLLSSAYAVYAGIAAYVERLGGVFADRVERDAGEQALYVASHPGPWAGITAWVGGLKYLELGESCSSDSDADVETAVPAPVAAVPGPAVAVRGPRAQRGMRMSTGGNRPRALLVDPDAMSGV